MPAGRRGRGLGVSELPLPAPSPHARQDVLDDRSCQERKSRFVNVHPTPARAALPVSQRTKLHRAGLGRSAAGAEAWLERPTLVPLRPRWEPELLSSPVSGLLSTKCQLQAPTWERLFSVS